MHKDPFRKHADINTPHLATGISVFAAVSLFLIDPDVTPGISTGGASSKGWIALASFSRCATNSGYACNQTDTANSFFSSRLSYKNLNTCRIPADKPNHVNVILMIKSPLHLSGRTCQSRFGSWPNLNRGWGTLVGPLPPHPPAWGWKHGGLSCRPSSHVSEYMF